MEDNTEKCTICLSDFEDTEDVRYATKINVYVLTDKKTLD